MEGQAASNRVISFSALSLINAISNRMGLTSLQPPNDLPALPLLRFVPSLPPPLISLLPSQPLHDHIYLEQHSPFLLSNSDGLSVNLSEEGLNRLPVG